MRVLIFAGLLIFSRSLSAQVDPTGHWRTFETTHFSIHVREEYRALGPRVAGEAELAWTALSRLITPPARRIEIVVADNLDETNGYASTYPVPHVIVFALPPAGDVELHAYDRWLRLVITHELAHVFHLDLAHGWWRAGRTVLGRAPFLFPNDYTTPWMREGLAVFYESRLTGAGRMGGGYLRGVVRAAVDEEGGLRLDAANTPTPKWPSGTRAYAFGAAFFENAAARFGDSAISRFAHSLARKPIPYLQLGSAWRRVSGEGIRETWASSQRPEIGYDDSNSPTVPPSPGPALLSRLRLTIPPRVSPDGRFIALAYNDGTDATWLRVLDRTAPGSADSLASWRRVARLDAANGLAWMPDGRILTSRLEFTDARTRRADLWAIALDGRATRLSRGQRLLEPDVAPDGAVVAVRAVAGGRELVLLEAGRLDGLTARVIGVAEPGVEYATPRFNPSGELIAVVRVQGGWHDIRVVDRLGRVLRDVTRDSVPDLMPAFSPDGRFLVWSREVDGIPQIVGERLARDAAVAAFTSERYAAFAPAPLGQDSVLYLAYHSDGFRLTGAALSNGAPVSVGVADSARVTLEPATEIRSEHDYHAIPSVLPKYWIPQFYIEPGGSWIGVISSGNDALVRHLWATSVLVGIGSLGGQVGGNVAYVFEGLRNVVLDGSVARHPEQFVGAQSLPGGGTTPVILCCNPHSSLDAGITFLRRRWRTQVALRFGVEATEDDDATRRGFSLAGTVAHAVSPALAISTQDGWRVGASIRHRARTDGTLQSTEAIVRGSAYLSASSGSFARQVFAVRAAFGTVSGNDSTDFGVGGVSSASIPVLPGVVLGGGARTFQVRGYAPGTLRGRRALSVSIENRVPLALVDRGLGMVPLGLDRLSAALFSDAGVAWSSFYCPTFAPGPGVSEPQNCGSGIWSVGAELSADLGLGYSLPLRVRFGGALRITDNGKPGGWIALGSAF